MNQFITSKTVFDRLKDQCESQKELRFPVPGLRMHHSPLFPFEIMYAACDVETKEEYRIPSGELCDGIAFAPTDESAYDAPMLNPYFFDDEYPFFDRMLSLTSCGNKTI